MRCAICGFPLSPSRNTCPRCGSMTTGISGKQHSRQMNEAPEASYSQQPWNPPAAPTVQNMSGVQHHPFPGQPMPSSFPPQPSFVRQGKRSQTGFTVAGLCVLTGGLILVFVYLMFLNIGGLTPNTQQGNNGQRGNPTTSTPANQGNTATSTPSPTTNYPGQQYIDNAQMASAVDKTTAQPTQVTTTFTTQRPIYVTFSTHTGGQPGAACLLWYLNNQQISHFEIALTPSTTPQHMYSYVNIQGTGSAYVEIYWATSVQCTDKVLAQHANFTITA